jgi:hypothetical protein
MLTAVLLGFVLGVRHAFDPDHVVAVSTITARNRGAWKAAWIGASWGLGHSATVITVGAAIIALHIAVPEALTRVFECGVGVMLVGLGIANLVAAKPGRAGGRIAPTGACGPLHRALARSGLVGVAHGLAGSAAVVLLAVAAMPTRAAAIAYLLLFGVGTVTGMIGSSLIMSAPLAWVGRNERAQRATLACTGAVSLLLGCFLVYEFGAASGLTSVS